MSTDSAMDQIPTMAQNGALMGSVWLNDYNQKLAYERFCLAQACGAPPNLGSGINIQPQTIHNYFPKPAPQPPAPPVPPAPTQTNDPPPTPVTPPNPPCPLPASRPGVSPLVKGALATLGGLGLVGGGLGIGALLSGLGGSTTVVQPAQPAGPQVIPGYVGQLVDSQGNPITVTNPVTP